MLQLKEKELPFLESFTGDKYTSPFFLFSRIDTRPIVQKPFNIIFDLRAKQALWKKSAYGENFASYQRIGARWYDPEIGLWTTPDPMAQFLNPYGYGGDPVNYVDPDGRSRWWKLWKPSTWNRTYNYINNENRTYETNASCRDKWTERFEDANIRYELETIYWDKRMNTGTAIYQLNDENLWLSSAANKNDKGFNRLAASYMVENGDKK